MVARHFPEARAMGKGGQEMKWLMILMTWYGDVPSMTQDFEYKDEAACERAEAKHRRDWEDAPREFVYIIDCREKK